MPSWSARATATTRSSSVTAISRIPDEHESRDLLALLQHRQLGAVLGERDAAVEVTVLRPADGAAPFEARHHVHEGPELEPAVVEREQRAELAGDATDNVVDRRALRDHVGDAVHPRDRLRRTLTPALRSAPATRHLADQQPDSEQDEHGLDVVPGLDLHREVTDG